MKTSLMILKNRKIDWMRWAPLAAGAIAAVSLASCTSRKSEQQPGVSDDNKVVVSEKHARQLLVEAETARAAGRRSEADEKASAAADEYARIGELLLLPEGIEYADKMFAKALEIAPNHAKANFYKAGTEPVLLGKGILPRIERLITSEDDQVGLEVARTYIKRKRMPELTAFVNKLPAGERAFFTYHDVQRFQRERMLPALLASVERLKRIDLSRGPLKLNFTPDRFRTEPLRSVSYTYWTTYCRETAEEGYKCEYSNYDYRHEDKPSRNEFAVDQHDLKAIRAAYQAMADGVRVGTAYSAEDSELVIRQLRAKDIMRRRYGWGSPDSNSSDWAFHKYDIGGLTAQDVVETLREFPGFLVLEKDQQLAEVARSAPEVLRNALELDELSAELCGNEARTEENSLFTMICLTYQNVRTLRMALDVATGPSEVELGRDSTGRTVRIVMDLSAVLNTPPRDLKSLLPTSFDRKGRPTRYPDPTMGGLFPNGDVVEKFKLLGTTKPILGAETTVRRAVRTMKDHL